MNPYIRAAQKVPAIKEEATIKLDQRLQDAETIDGILMERARDEQGRFIADDPSTPDVDEAWVEVQP